MVIRVVLAGLFVALPTATSAIEPASLLPARGFELPYDLTGFVVERQRIAREPAPVAARVPQPEPAVRQIAARAPRDLRPEDTLDGGAAIDIALAYDLTGLVPPLQREPGYRRLDYELRGLLGASR